MRIKRIAFAAASTVALVTALAGTASAEDYNQGDDSPGCVPYISGPVLPTHCGAGEIEHPTPCDIATMTEPNCGEANGAGGWEPDPIIEEPIAVISEAVPDPEVTTPVTQSSQVKTVPRGGVSAGNGSTNFTGTDTYL